MQRSLTKNVARIIVVDTYASQEDVKDHAKLYDLNNPVEGTPFASLYKVADQVDTLDRELRGPAGMMAKIDQRTTALENKRQVNAVEFGGLTFKDPEEVQAWYLTLNNPEAYALCTDMVTLLCNASPSVDSQAEGLKLAADSKRVGY